MHSTGSPWIIHFSLVHFKVATMNKLRVHAYEFHFRLKSTEFKEQQEETMLF
jgi:hypothetical protein